MKTIAVIFIACLIVAPVWSQHFEQRQDRAGNWYPVYIDREYGMDGSSLVPSTPPGPVYIYEVIVPGHRSQQVYRVDDDDESDD